MFLILAALAAARQLTISDEAIQHYGENVPQRLSREYATAFSDDPAYLTTMARRLSRLNPSCSSGLSYMSVASSAIAHESFIDPSSINFPTSSNPGHWNLGDSVREANKDASTQLKPHILSMMESMLINGEDFDALALPVAQRTFSGADRFEQDWLSAIRILETLHARNLGSKESLEYLVAIYNKLSADPRREYYVSPEICARAAMNLLPNHDAHDVLGMTLVRLASSVHSEELKKGILLEARHQFAKTPAGSFNSIALDLSLAAPIMSHAIFSITPALYRLDPVATNVIAHMTGDIGCNESWALTSNIIRRYLWYHANKSTLARSRQPPPSSWLESILMGPLEAASAMFMRSAGGPSMTIEMLEKMANAGVEDAEWALALRLEDDHPAKHNLLSFSAHKGRAAAQLLLARIGNEKQKSRYNRPRLTKVQQIPAPADLEDEAAVLDAWLNAPRPKKLSEKEIRLANLELITRTPSRWEGYDLSDRMSTFIGPYTEALILESWTAFFGIGRDQALRDCLITLNKVPSKLIKYSYLWIYQGLLLLNGLLLNVRKTGWQRKTFREK